MCVSYRESTNRSADTIKEVNDKKERARFWIFREQLVPKSAQHLETHYRSNKRYTTASLCFRTIDWFHVLWLGVSSLLYYVDFTARALPWAPPAIIIEDASLGEQVALSSFEAVVKGFQRRSSTAG